MLLFVGLGNPSPDNENNRHNIGFKIILCKSKYTDNTNSLPDSLYLKRQYDDYAGTIDLGYMHAGDQRTITYEMYLCVRGSDFVNDNGSYRAAWANFGDPVNLSIGAFNYNGSGSAVPEPATLMLFGCGIMLMAAFSRRQAD